MVRDAKSDLPAFKEMLRRMPPPLGKTTTIDNKCGTAFAMGIEKRKRRRVFCPGWCAGCAWVSRFVHQRRRVCHSAQRRGTGPRTRRAGRGIGRSVSARFTDGDEYGIAEHANRVR